MNSPCRPNSQGGTAFSFRNEHEGELFFGRPAAEGRVKSLGDMLFVPRYVASFDLTDAQAAAAIARATAETGLPAADPVRFGPAPLAEAIVRAATAARGAAAPVGVEPPRA